MATFDWVSGYCSTVFFLSSRVEEVIPLAISTRALMPLRARIAASGLALIVVVQL